jgi:hypothetical protein
VTRSTRNLFLAHDGLEGSVANRIHIGLVSLRSRDGTGRHSSRLRHFEAEIIVLCVRWYLRFGLSFRSLEEIMAERNFSVTDGTSSNSHDGGAAYRCFQTWGTQIGRGFP